MTPEAFTATITFRGFGTVEQLEERLRQTITTHPTLSFAIDEVEVVHNGSAHTDEELEQQDRGGAS